MLHHSQPVNTILCLVLSSVSYIGSQFDWAAFDVAFISPVMHTVVTAGALVSMLLGIVSLYQKLFRNK